MPDELSQEEALQLLLEDASKGRGPTKDTTEPRIAATWFKLTTQLNKPCENPDCCDTREANDKGRLVTVQVKGKFMCRFCFLAGWLSSDLK